MGIPSINDAAKQIGKLEGELRRLRLRHAADAQRIEELERKLMAYRVVLEDQAPEVDQSLIREVTPKPQRKLFARKELPTLCFEGLKVAGRPLTTAEMLTRCGPTTSQGNYAIARHEGPRSTR